MKITKLKSVLLREITVVINYFYIFIQLYYIDCMNVIMKDCTIVHEKNKNT